MLTKTSKLQPKLAMLFTFLFLSFGALTGCDRDEGGAEEFGENMDEAAEDAGNTMEDACEDAKDGMGADDTDC